MNGTEWIRSILKVQGKIWTIRKLLIRAIVVRAAIISLEIRLRYTVLTVQAGLG